MKMLKWLCVVTITLGFGAVQAIGLPTVDDRDIKIQINEYFAKINRIKAQDAWKPTSNEIAQGLNAFVESGKITLDEMKVICGKAWQNPVLTEPSARSSIDPAFDYLMDMRTFYPRVNAVLQKAIDGGEISADDVKLVESLSLRIIGPEKRHTRWYYSFGPSKDEEYINVDDDFVVMRNQNKIYPKTVNTPAYQQALDAKAFVEACQKGRTLPAAQRGYYLASIKQMSARIPAMAELAPLVEACLAHEAEALAERERAAKVESEEKEARAVVERELAEIAAEEAEERAKKERAEEAEKEKARIAAVAEAARAREAEVKAERARATIEENEKKVAADRELARIAAETAEQERLETERMRNLEGKPKPTPVDPDRTEPTPPAEPKSVITPKIPGATPERVAKRSNAALAATGIFGLGAGLGGVFLVKKVARLVSLNRLIKAAQSNESVNYGKLRSLKNERSELVRELKLLTPAATLMALAAVYAHRKSYENAPAA